MDSGRENSDKDVIEWLKEAESRGAGEILITSVDNDGTKKGFDLKLYEKVNNICNLPLIISGGMGKPEDLLKLEKFNQCNAIAVGTILHYNLTTIPEIKKLSKKIINS